MTSWLWKIGGVAVALIAAYFLVTMYGGARYKQGKADSDFAWGQKVIQAEKEKLTAYQAGVASVNLAETGYHETVREKIIPITKTIIERSTEYARTPEGAAICLSPERVQLLAGARSALFPATDPVTAPGEPHTMHPNGASL